MPSSRGPEAHSLVSILHNCAAAAAAGLQVVAEVQQQQQLSSSLHWLEKSCGVHLHTVQYLSAMLSGLCNTVDCGMNDWYRCVVCIVSVQVAFCTRRVSEHRERCRDAKSEKDGCS